MNKLSQLPAFLFSFLFLLSPIQLSAQQPLPDSRNRDPSLYPIGSSEIRDTTPSEVLPLDTPVAMAYVLLSDPDEDHLLLDSFMWKSTRHFPLAFYKSHLGNYGSPVRTLTPGGIKSVGFATGWDQYDDYFLDADSFRFYHQHIPVARIKYSQASKDDTYLTLEFGRSFAKGVSLSFIYDRINQLGEFNHQHQQNTALGIGVWHKTLSGRYEAFYVYIANTANGEENGGISDPAQFDSTFVRNEFVPVFLTTGRTTHKHKNFSTKQIFHLISDTSDIGIDLWLGGQLGSRLYKYVDEFPETSGSYYGQFLTDPRGIRQYTFLHDYHVTGGISVPWGSANSTLQTSIEYRSTRLEQEPIESRINEVFWNSSGKFNWLEPLELRGEVKLGLGQAGGSFAFNAKAALQVGSLGYLEGLWSVLSRKPYLVETRLFVDQQPVYNIDFENPFTSEVGVGWNWPQQSLLAQAKWIIFDNYIFWDTAAIPQQISGSFQLARFQLTKEFNLNWVGLSANIIWQPDAKTELAIPELMYRASIYGRIKIFRKKVTLMPGIDLTYHDSFHGVSYFPVNGRYHLTGRDPIPDYIRMDAALGVHINFIKAFVRMDDIQGLWDSRVLYQADYYPHFPAYFRIGLEASFFN